MPDCAITPGARKSRYGMPPVGMACRRLKVWPKITSHSTGWTARVNISVRSCLSFCSSTRQNVATRSGKRRQIGGSAMTTASANATCRPSRPADLADAARALGAVEAAAGRVAEDVVERRGRSQLAFQLGRGALRLDAPEVHQRDAIAEQLGLLHVVGRQQDRH